MSQDSDSLFGHNGWLRDDRQKKTHKDAQVTLKDAAKTPQRHPKTPKDSKRHPKVLQRLLKDAPKTAKLS